MKRLSLILIVFLRLTALKVSAQTVLQIDSVCHSIDHSNFIERIFGEDTYPFIDSNKTVHRIRHQSDRADLFCMITFYYKDKKVIKAEITCENRGSDMVTSTVYSATYYFDKNICIKAIDEDKKYSNSVEILNEGITIQDKYYKTNKKN